MLFVVLPSGARKFLGNIQRYSLGGGAAMAGNIWYKVTGEYAQYHRMVCPD